jgi:hypothetical protein
VANSYFYFTPGDAKDDLVDVVREILKLNAVLFFSLYFQKICIINIDN